MTTFIQPSLAKGEISPALHGRVDTAAYQIALKKARNVIIHPYGGASNRTGLQYIAPCKYHDTATRLIDFEFKTTDAYILEFGDQYMRVIRNDALVTETAKTGATATAANPVVVTVSSHGYSDGDEVIMSGFTEMTQLNGNIYIVSNPTANTFELTHQVTEDNIDGSGWDAETTGGTVAKIYEITTPYAAADLFELNTVQSADVMTITHPSYPIKELTRSDHNAWTLTEPTFAPSQDHPTGLTLTVDGANNSATYRYQVTAISEETGEESLPALNSTTKTVSSATAADPVVCTSTSHGFANGDEVELNGFDEMTEVNGRRFTVANVTANTFELEDEDGSAYTAESTGGTANLTWVKTTAGTTNPDNTISWTAVDGAERYAVYRDENGLFALVGETENTSFKDDNIDADLSFSPPKSRNPFRGSGNYPAAATYFEQRRAFGGSTSHPDTVYYSQTGRTSNFSISNPLQQDDAITATLNARQVNSIRHFVPQNDLLVFTSGAEWRVNSGSDVAFAYDTLRQKPQSHWGISHRKPLVVGNIILFVKTNEANVRSMGYQFVSDSYSGNDLNLLTNHFVDGYTIDDWALLDNRSLVLSVRSDGKVLTMTFQPEQEVVAWTSWDTKGKFLSVATAAVDPSFPLEKTAYFVVQRTVNGNVVRYIEKVYRHLMHTDEVQDAFFVDSGLSLDSPIPISSISLADPIVITTSSSHGLSNGDEIDISDILWEPDVDSLDNETQPEQLNGGRYKVANKTATTFELQTTAGVDVDGTAFNAYVEDGNVRKVVTTITGLDHLEGEGVVALSNGDFVDGLTVSEGSITLPRGASRVHIGLEYFSDIETLDIEAPQGTISSRKKKVSCVTIRVDKSRGVFIGPSFEKLVEMKQREFENYGEPTQLLSGTKKIILKPDWNSNGRIAIRQRYPLPLTVLALTPDVELGDE